MINWEYQGQLVLKHLQKEKAYKNRSGIYHYTQIHMAYNSNRIEGSRLSEEQTRSLFETRTILSNGQEVIYSDDIIEASNHFNAFNYMLSHANDTLSEGFIKKIHEILTIGTQESQESYFNVGDYKKVPNLIGSTIETAAPNEVPQLMKSLLQSYNELERLSLNDIIDFHVSFEKIHPFQNGNGRTGRIIAFKECLKNNITPFIITEDMKPYYIRGLNEYNKEKGYLIDTCLYGQDMYQNICKKLIEPKLNKEAISITLPSIKGKSNLKL